MKIEIYQMKIWKNYVLFQMEGNNLKIIFI